MNNTIKCLSAFLSISVIYASDGEVYDPTKGPLVGGAMVSQPPLATATLEKIAKSFNRPEVKKDGQVVLEARQCTLHVPRQTIVLIDRLKAVDDSGQAWTIAQFLAGVLPNGQAPHVVVANRFTNGDTEELKKRDAHACLLRGTTPTSGEYTYWDWMRKDERTRGAKHCDGKLLEVRQVFLDYLRGLDNFTNGQTVTQLHALRRIADTKLCHMQDTVIGQVTSVLIPLIDCVAGQAQELRRTLDQNIKSAKKVLGEVVQDCDTYIQRRTDPVPGVPLSMAVMDDVANTNFGYSGTGAAPESTRVSVERVDITDIVEVLRQVYRFFQRVSSRNFKYEYTNNIKSLLDDIPSLEDGLESVYWDDLSQVKGEHRQIPKCGFKTEIEALLSPLKRYEDIFKAVDARPSHADDEKLKVFTEGVRLVTVLLHDLQGYLDNAGMKVLSVHTLQLMQAQASEQPGALAVQGGTATLPPLGNLSNPKENHVKEFDRTSARGADKKVEDMARMMAGALEYMQVNFPAMFSGLALPQGMQVVKQ